jgi:hypothetical protein
MSQLKNNTRKFVEYPDLPINRIADKYLPDAKAHQEHLADIARANKGRGFAVAKVRA